VSLWYGHVSTVHPAGSSQLEVVFVLDLDESEVWTAILQDRRARFS